MKKASTCEAFPWQSDRLNLRPLRCDPLANLIEVGLRRESKLRLASAVSETAASAAAPLARLVAVPAKHRAVATRLKRYSCGLATTRTNHRCTLRWSRTVPGAPTTLIVLLCLTASLTTLWGRITTFLKERLIRSGEGEVLPAVTTRKLHISGHGSPRRDCIAQSRVCVKS
jgi:hypothetical protein